MLASRGATWQAVRNVEDLLAVLARIEDRRRVIRLHAWQRSSWDAIYDESVAMRVDLDDLRDYLGQVWQQVYTQVASGGARQ